ncbi:hypothetical protein QN277_004630 [Acacia crassicarpa]|uniref:Uncharacterized protein n=1 Tax=Acacia crassicarpa TaxID=499986 RepID=A0AAE1MC14_9FABA|nr:hypothetical protein QN277_004630 [Acacia crassicarpa]
MEQLELNPNSVNKLDESSSSVVDDDGPPILSSQALAALKEFLVEQDHSVADSDVPTTGGDSKVALVSEDWRLSQFWYSAETAKTLAEEVITLCQGTDHSRVACIACPTLYDYLKDGGHNYRRHNRSRGRARGEWRRVLHRADSH